MMAWWARWDVVVVQGFLTTIMVCGALSIRRGNLRLEKQMAQNRETFLALLDKIAAPPPGN
jgi:hypothetical protein